MNPSEVPWGQPRRVALPLGSTKIPIGEHTQEGGGFEDGRIAAFSSALVLRHDGAERMNQGSE
jgi:hypothetical protein